MAKKWPISRQEYKELDTLAKRANQRLASMKEGQREAVEFWTKGQTFSRAVPKTRREYEQRMKDVERFLAAETSTRRGWEAIKKRAVESAGETLRRDRKYDLTDTELRNIFKEVDKKSQKQLYKVLDLVQAKKYRAKATGADFDLDEAIMQAVRSHISAADAIKQKTRARKAAEKRSAKDLRK